MPRDAYSLRQSSLSLWAPQFSHLQNRVSDVAPPVRQVAGTRGASEVAHVKVFWESGVFIPTKLPPQEPCPEQTGLTGPRRPNPGSKGGPSKGGPAAGESSGEHLTASGQALPRWCGGDSGRKDRPVLTSGSFRSQWERQIEKGRR